MNSNQNLTYNRQSPHLHPTCDSYRGQTSLSTPTPLSRSQPSGDSDLFATLLFDRQRAYQRPSNKLHAPDSSSQSKVRDATPATQSLQSKHKSQVTGMPPTTRFKSEKQERQVKGKRITKTPSAKPATKRAGSRVAENLENAAEKASQEDKDVVTISSNKEEARVIEQLRDELQAANARIEQLEGLLETKQATSRNPSIQHDNHKDTLFKVDISARKSQLYDSTSTREDNESLTKESAQLKVTDNHKKPVAITVQVQPQLPSTPQSPASSVPPVSPYPDSTSTIILNEEDLKLENVRATYTKVKTKLDTLKIVVRKLDWCTNSMDLSNFGEFGVHMKRLREWLEEDEQQQLQRQQRK